jgi:hypothetical protein
MLVQRTIVTAMAATALLGAAPATGAPADVKLIPHLAVYDLTLATSRGNASVQSVRGRIVYDFGGNRCEGYTLQFRQVSQLDTGEGRQVMSDLRSTTWEEGTARNFRFVSQNFLNDAQIEGVEGRAERRKDAVGVALTKPEAKKLDIDRAVVFPAEHLRHIIAAAREGKTLLELPVFDGSETGEKVYHTLTVIGRPVPPGEHKPGDAAGKQAALGGLMRWPVKISYFEKAGSSGEQTPIYSIGFELYENGISRALMLDYNDFVIAGEVSSLEVREVKGCP